MKQGKAYEDFKRTLMKVCQNEGLKLVEAKLRNPKSVYFRFEDRIVLNVRQEGKA